MISCRRTEIRSAHLALKGRPTVGDKGLKTPSSADNRLIDTTQTAREESEIFIRKPEVRDQMTGLHGIASHELLLEAKVKKMLQRIEPAVDGRPRTAVLMLGLHKVVHLAKRHLGEGDSHRHKKHVEIERITNEGVRRELPAFEVRSKSVDGGLADIVHGLSPLEPLALFDLRHGLVVLGALGPVIELGIAQRDVEGAMAHQLFEHL